MDLGDVFDAAGSFCEAMDGPEGDAPLSEGTAEEHKLPMVEPEVNEFGRMTEWYHCGVRNTGSVCKCCGEYRRDRTVLDDPDSGKKIPYWKCPECGINTVGEVCERCGQPRRSDVTVERPKPGLLRRIYIWFLRRKWAIAVAWAIFLIVLVVVMWLIEK